MTSTPPAAGSSSTGIPLRPLTAWALVALPGVVIVFGFLTWAIPPSRTDLFHRFLPDHFTGLVVLAAPLLAVLVATRLGRALPHAKLICLIALVEYAVAFLLGTLGFLITLASRFDSLDGGIYAVGGVVQNLGHILATGLQLGLLLLAALWTYHFFTGLGARLPRLRIRID